MGVLTTALLAPLRYWREAIRCFCLCLIFAGGALVLLSKPVSGLPGAATGAVSYFASHSILLAIPAAAIGFAAAILLLIVIASSFVGWHRFLIHGEDARWLPGFSVPRCLAYVVIAVATGLAVLLPFVVVALLFTFSFVSFTGEQPADGLTGAVVAWFTSWTGTGASDAVNSINVEFQDRLLGLPYIAFDDVRFGNAAVGMEVMANVLAYCLADGFLYAGGLVLVRIAAGTEAPSRPPWFAVGMALNFLAYTIAWLPAAIAAELGMAAISWDGLLALLAPVAYALSLLAGLFAVAFLAAAVSYLSAGDPWRYPGFYGLD